MTQENKVNERSIKVALSQGYITSKEADNMQKVYLHRLDPAPTPQTKLKINITV